MKQPTVHNHVFIAPGAVVRGDVTLEENANIWYNAVIRGDTAPVIVGKNSNVQDNAVIHVDAGCPTIIEENVTVGHGAILHGCKVEKEALIGMGAIVTEDVAPYEVRAGVPARLIKKRFDDCKGSANLRRGPHSRQCSLIHFNLRR